MINKQLELYNLCIKFIENNGIRCAETIYQTDNISENSLKLVENICDIIGYINIENDE
jgi:hypothetical protein